MNEAISGEGNHSTSGRKAGAFLPRQSHDFGFKIVYSAEQKGSGGIQEGSLNSWMEELITYTHSCVH